MIKILPEIKKYSKELDRIYKDIHSHPELGFEEIRTSQLVESKLKEFGVDEIHTGIAKTGVVAVINGVNEGNRTIGLRADMDALPIQEATGLSYASKYEGKMHACGHDAHTTMLLGAAKHLTKYRNFRGKAVLIFQPAEEGLGGAVGMINEELFERFPCDEIYGIHNSPNGKLGEVGICKGPAMAGASFFDIKVLGKGSHAARPQESSDPIVIVGNLITQLQTIVSRNVPPDETLVFSITKVNGGTAYNVIPEEVNLCGTIRFFSKKVFKLVERRMKEICRGFEISYNIKVIVKLKKVFDVLENNYELSDKYMDTAETIVGIKNVERNLSPRTGSEDFADMLKLVKGAYCRIGHNGKEPLHSPKFILDTKVIPIGSSLLAKLVEDRLVNN